MSVWGWAAMTLAGIAFPSFVLAGVIEEEEGNFFTFTTIACVFGAIVCGAIAVRGGGL